MTLPVIGILAIAATACQGVGLTEARQAVDNQRAISEIEEREVLPIERELETLYETDILPRERELEDLWNQVQVLENGQFKNDYDNSQDPWAPGGAASLIQQEFNEKYAEIDRLYRELETESRRIQIEQQFGDNSNGGIDPAITGLEDQRFSLQRELNRLHQFGRRPIEDLYLQMNELNASNGWSQTDIYAADELNRQIADIHDEIARAQSSGAQFNDQNQQELFSIDDELNSLRTFGFDPVHELRNRIFELEQQLVFTTDGTVDADGTVNDDVVAEVARLIAEMTEALAPLMLELDSLILAQGANYDAAQAEINALLAQVETTVVSPVDTSALQAEIDALQQQIIDQQAAAAPVIVDYDTQIADLQAQIGVIYQTTDTGIAGIEAQIDSLEAQIDALDTTAADYATVLADLEGQIATLQSSIAQAIATEATDVTALEAQISALTDGKATAQAASDAETADLQAQINELQAQIDAANSNTGTSTTSISQETLDQIAVIEQNRDANWNLLQADIDHLNAEIAAIQATYQHQISELENAGIAYDPAGVPTVTGTTDNPELEFEIQTLRDQADQLERDINEKIRVLEERRNKLQSSLDGAVAGGVDITGLEDKLVLLHDQLNTLQNGGFDASRNYNILMEELQTKSVQLEKDLSLNIRALEDKLWELDERIAELYHSSNGSTVDPYARFNDRLKEIELKRFELDQRRWDLDDEQQIAYNQFNNFGSEQRAEAEAKRDEVLGPLYDQIDVLEEELRSLRLTQREIEDRLRIARRSVEDQVRALENLTLELIDDALTTAEEATDNGNLDGLDLSLLEGLDPSVIGELETTNVDPATGEVIQ